MGQIWDAFTKSYKTEGITGAKTVSGDRAYAFKTGYDIGSEMKISGFEINYVRRRSGLGSNQQVLVVLANLKFQRYFINNGSLDLYNTYENTNARSRLLGKRIDEWMSREKLKTSDIPAHASYQAANPGVNNRDEVIRFGGSDEWITKDGGEAKDIELLKLPDMPSLPGINFNLPSFPDLGGLKGSLQVTALFAVAVVLIIVYMLTGKGKKGLTVVT